MYALDNAMVALLVVGSDEQARGTLQHRLDTGQFAAVQAVGITCALDAMRERAYHAVLAIDEPEMIESLCRAMQATDILLPLIALTDPAPDLLERLVAAGVADIVSPYAPSALLALRLRQAVQAARYPQAEIAQREAEDRYRQFIENTTETVFTLSLDGTLTWISPSFRHHTGWAPDEWIGKPFAPLIYFDDLPLVLHGLDMLLRGQTVDVVEARFNMQDGEIGVAEIFAKPLMRNGELVGVWGIFRNITDRRRAEESEMEQRTLADALRHTAAVMNATLNRDEVFDRILIELESVLPYDSANIMLIEGNVARIVHSRGYVERNKDQEILSFRFNIDEIPNLKYTVETQRALAISDVDHYPGWLNVIASAWIRSHVTAPIVVDGQVIGFLNLDSALYNSFSDKDAERLLTFADQAAVAIRNANLYDALRQQAEALEQRVSERTAELERERAQLHAILDSMNEGVIYDENLTVRYINRALTELTGYRIDDWNGYLELLKTDDQTDEEMARLIHELYNFVDAGRVWSRQMRVRRKDGTEFEAEITVTEVVGADGKPAGAVTVIRDVSQEKALQEQKSRFVAYASHELRTPITNLKTRLYLLRKQPQKLDDHLSVLETVTERMQRLVEDMLDLSRFERGAIPLQQKRIHFQRLIKDVVDTQHLEAARRELRLVHTLPSLPVFILADPDRIVQVLTNLITNAINYTAPEGAIHVHLTEAHDSSGAWAVLSVDDEGIGIAEEYLPHIFQPFFRGGASSTVSGSGLGLSITRQIVELHGGTISVESRVGLGSSFRVRLPLARPGRTAPEAENAVQRS